jgi:hypothetical protein
VKPRVAQERPPSGSTNATYVYCLVHSKARPSLRGAPGSVPGAGPLRLLQIDRGIWAAVADAPLEHFSADALQREMQDVEGISRHALAHASVIEFLFRRAAVIPLKLFTLFSSDERATVHVRGRLPTLKRMFASLAGREEWAVRIIAGEVEREAARTLDSGRAYLTLKKRLHEQGATTSRKTVRELDSALRSLGGVAVKSRKETFPAAAKGRPYVAGASFLVNARRRASWIKQISSVTATMGAAGHRVEVSGPWPPYHFVSR